MPDFKIGEVVNITIEGVRITRPRMATGVTILDKHGVPHVMPPQAAVTRVAPADWPPRPGDLWHDRNGCPWFAADIHDEAETDEENLVLIPVWELSGFAPDPVIQKYGPLTLVHREGAEDETECPAGDPECLSRADECHDACEKPDPKPGHDAPDRPGYVISECSHPIARDDWHDGWRRCRRCPAKQEATDQ